MAKNKIAGWGAPEHARKLHYFAEGRSLCGRWLFTGTLYEFRIDDGNFCVTCQRRLAQADAAEHKGEKLHDELLLRIFTSLPSETDDDIEERCKEAQKLADRLETLIEHLFGPGGQYHKKGYSISLERR